MEGCPAGIKEHINPQFVDQSMLGAYMNLVLICRESPSLVNFGIGSPNYELPQFVREAAIESIQGTEHHQYSRTQGLIPTMTQVANHFGKRMGRTIDPLTEVITSAGATGAYYNLLEAFVHPGDEVVIFTPMYPFFYPPIIHRGAIPVALNLLKTGKPYFDREEFKAAFSPKTRLLMINTPHNPSGKIFTKEELTFIAEFLQKEHPEVLVVADEVYCDFIFGETPHTYTAELPGMWERTVTLFSFGKVFNVTGWRLGFALGPKELLHAMASVQLYTMLNISTPIVHAAEKILQTATLPYQGKDSYYAWLREFYKSRYLGVKDALVSSPLGFEVLDPEGGYTLIAKIDKAVVGMPLKFFYKDYKTSTKEDTLESFEKWLELESPDHSIDFAFCYWLVERCGVVFYPLSGMTELLLHPVKEKSCTNFIRASLCRDDESIAKLKTQLGK